EQAQASSTTIAEDTTKDITEDITENTTDDTTDHMSKKREMPAQTKLKEELIRLNLELSQLQDLEDKGLIPNAASERKKVVQNEILQAEDQLKAAGINTQLIKPVGRPRLKEAQPGLLKTILRLVSLDGQVEERKRLEIIRLLPKQFNTEEGKQHVKTVPVKLLKSQNTARKRHKDIHFCASLVRNIKEMVSLLGPQSVLTIFQDDKARIPLGLAAANKQAPILMRVEYRVELPDHDWVIAKKHKLILSVYAILEMQSGKYGNAKAITYLGPMFIRIRSGKHDTSTAYTHSKDFDDLMSDERLHNFTTTEDGQSKPVVLMLTDGGPDENLCYKKTIQVMIEHFIKYDLDTIIA
ncbi:11108_t:CDS:2, partial [Gigaspora rosea]